MNTFASSRRRMMILAATVTLAACATTVLLPGAAALAQITYDTAPRLDFSYTDLRANSTNFPVGSTNVPVGAWVDGNGVKHKSRVFATFDISGYAGTHLISAALRLRDDKLTDCEVRNLAVWETEVAGTAPTWQEQPVRLSQLGSFNAQPCPGVASLDLSGPVAAAVAAGQQRLALEIAVAPDAQPGEGDPVAGRSLSWYYGLQLSIGYNNPPVVEVEHLYNAARPCDTTAPFTRVNTNPLQLGAAFNDIDQMNSSMTAEYAIWPVDHPEQRTTITRGNVFSHRFSPVDVPAGVLVDEGTFSWQARVSDGTDTSAWSQTCSFVYDNTPPANAPVVTSPNYPTDGDGSTAGAAPAFTFSPNGADDVVAYQYSFGELGAVSGYSIGDYGIPQWTDPFDGPQFVRANQSNGSATVILPFPYAGELTLTVRSVDAAVNISPITQYVFWVGWTPPSVTASGGSAPGKPVTLTIAPYETVTGVVSYDYWIDDEPQARTVAAGPDGTASVEVTFPVDDEWHWVRVVSRSANGFVSSDNEWYYYLDNPPSGS